MRSESYPRVHERSVHPFDRRSGKGTPAKIQAPDRYTERVQKEFGPDLPIYKYVVDRPESKIVTGTYTNTFVLHISYVGRCKWKTRVIKRLTRSDIRAQPGVFSDSRPTREKAHPTPMLSEKAHPTPMLSEKAHPTPMLSEKAHPTPMLSHEPMIAAGLGETFENKRYLLKASVNDT